MKHKLFSARELCCIALFAAVIALSSWIAVPAAVPFTMQTFAVFFAVGTLGTKCGTAAVITYILLGAVGLPVFSGFRSGAGVLFSPTGGYIIGFVLAAIVSGALCARFGKKLLPRMLCMLAGLALCYVFGSVWFALVHGVNVKTALVSCVLPFVPFDTLKLFLASVLSQKMRKYVCLK